MTSRDEEGCKVWGVGLRDIGLREFRVLGFRA